MKGSGYRLTHLIPTLWKYWYCQRPPTSTTQLKKRLEVKKQQLYTTLSTTDKNEYLYLQCWIHSTSYEEFHLSFHNKLVCFIHKPRFALVSNWQRNDFALFKKKKKRKNAFESHAVYNAYQSTLRDSASCFYKLTKSLLLSSFPFFRHLQIWSCVAILLISIFISYVLIYGGNIHYKRAFLTVLTARENVQDTGFIALRIHWIKNIHIYNLKINLVISIHTNLALCSTTLTEVKSIYWVEIHTFTDCTYRHSW